MGPSDNIACREFGLPVTDPDSIFSISCSLPNPLGVSPECTPKQTVGKNKTSVTILIVMGWSTTGVGTTLSSKRKSENGSQMGCPACSYHLLTPLWAFSRRLWLSPASREMHRCLNSPCVCICVSMHCVVMCYSIGLGLTLTLACQAGLQPRPCTVVSGREHKNNGCELLLEAPGVFGSGQHICAQNYASGISLLFSFVLFLLS